MNRFLENKTLLICIFIVFGFLSGCCHIQKIGLHATEFSRNRKDYLEIWIPFGLAQSNYMQKDFLYFRREIPYTSNTEINAYNALNELLEGPNEQEKQKGAVPLVNEAGILDLRIVRGKARVNFSKEFAPGGGTLAVWQCRIAVEEVLRQFPEIRKAEIFVEGIPAIESLQP